MGRALVLLVLFLTPQDAGARRLVTNSTSTNGEILDPLTLLSSPGVNFELQPNNKGRRFESADDEDEDGEEVPEPDDSRINAILEVEELTERDHTRAEEQRHALNCHKFGNDPEFRRRMALSDPPQEGATGVDPHVIAVESEVFDEPSAPDYVGDNSSRFNVRALASDQLGRGMGSKELHRCVLRSYTSPGIVSKSFRNEITGLTENLELPTFPQTLGVFEIDALFHDRGALGTGEFYIVIIEAIAHEAGLATCSLKGDPTGHDHNAKGGDISKSYRKTWVVHGEVMENDIESKAELIAEHIKDNHNANAELKELAEQIKKAEKHIPFNHKLETAAVTFKKCKTAAGELTCKDNPVIKYLHDRAFTTSSEQHPTFDYVKLSSSDLQSVDLDPAPGFFIPNEHAEVSHVFVPNAAKGLAELKGSIDWHTTISSNDRCIPAMKQWLYVGIGTDSNEDLDLGIILYQKQDGGHKRHLLNFRNGEDWPEGRAVKKPGKHWNQAAEYSGDTRTGAGEGDDEWMFFDLSFLKVIGVDVIAIMVHVYDGTPGKFADLKGSFARFVMGDASGNERSDQALKWSGAETVDYIDLDELRTDGPPAALIGVLSLEASSKLVLPEKTIESKTPSFEKMPSGHVLQYPGDDGMHFNLAIKKYLSTCSPLDCDVGDSSCDIEKNVLGLSDEHCNAQRPVVGQPKMKETSPEDRKGSLTTVGSAELEQEAGAVFNPLDLLTPPISHSGPDIDPDETHGAFQTTDGEHLSGEAALEAKVDQRTATMNQDEWLHDMLIEFPGGPPGVDTLCTVPQEADIVIAPFTD